MKTRWSNHKSHINKLKKTCKIASHCIEEKKGSHILNRNNLKLFDSQLAEQLEVLLIEHVQIPPGSSKDDRTKLMESREKHWQHKLKTVSLYGGLNERSS